MPSVGLALTAAQLEPDLTFDQRDVFVDPQSGAYPSPTLPEPVPHGAALDLLRRRGPGVHSPVPRFFDDPQNAVAPPACERLTPADRYPGAGDACVALGGVRALTH